MVYGADRAKTIHPLFVRVTHWLNALAIFIMVLSGWRIYDAAPFFGFEFPKDATLGGWLAGALAWHFAGMWLLAVNGMAYLAYGVVSGHFRKRFLPISIKEALADVVRARRGRLDHAPGRYNAAQRLLYVGVILAVIVAILSGLAIWKPVQLQELTAVMGGYEAARRVHFFAMAAIVAFLVVHIALALTVKGALTPMFTGRAEASQ
ncbi:MAG: cytochrome b/b6 domain-containing protein [Methylocystis sp.]|uniref:cytochrome b/b6 domain-containing protein n=1 Tax=Methylocystis sp. TaxID=1911079 RepID=UPI003D0D1CD0